MLSKHTSKSNSILGTFSDMCPNEFFLDPCSRAIFDGENTDRDEYSVPVGDLERPIFMC